MIQGIAIRPKRGPVGFLRFRGARAKREASGETRIATAAAANTLRLGIAPFFADRTLGQLRFFRVEDGLLALPWSWRSW